MSFDKSKGRVIIYCDDCKGPIYGSAHVRGGKVRCETCLVRALNRKKSEQDDG